MGRWALRRRHPGGLNSAERELRAHLRSVSTLLKLFFPCEPDILETTVKHLVCEQNLLRIQDTRSGTSQTPGSLELIGPEPELPPLDTNPKAFVKLANAIVEHVENNHNILKGGRGSGQGKSKWTVCLHNATEPQPHGPAILALGVWTTKQRRITTELARIEKQLENFEDGNESEETQRLKQELIKKENELEEVIAKSFWQQFHVPVAIGHDALFESLRENVVYECRGILEFQSDRLFVLGLTLRERQLGLFLADRARIVQADAHIDIYKEPEVLIQVLASLASANGEQLGWDLTVKAFRDPSLSPLKCTEDDLVFSYERNFDKMIPEELDSPTFSWDSWVIQMPQRNPDGTISDTLREWYIGVEALSEGGGRAPFGRSTRVWKVIKLGASDFSQIYILKQNWRTLNKVSEPDDGMQPIEKVLSANGENRSLHEARMWALGGQPEEVVAFEDVRLGGEFVSTFEYCRKSIKHRNTDPIYHAPEAQPDNDSEERPANSGTSGESKPLQNRVLSRTVFRSAGINIEFFSDLIELLQTFHGAITLLIFGRSTAS